MTDPIEARIRAALAEQGSRRSRRSDAPSEAALTLMDEFLEEDKLGAVQRLFAAFSRRHPVNRGYLGNALTGKIRNFLVNRRGIRQSALAAWDVGIPGWDKRLKDPRLTAAAFEAEVEAIAREMRRDGPG